jgi:hypothetical protein
VNEKTGPVGIISKKKYEEIVENSSVVNGGIFNPWYLEQFIEHIREDPAVLEGAQVVITAAHNKVHDVGFLIAEIQSEPVHYIGLVGEEIIHG